MKIDKAELIGWLKTVESTLIDRRKMKGDQGDDAGARECLAEQYQISLVIKKVESMNG